MINWFNMPVEGLSNGGQFEIKELTATENKTYEKDGEVYNKVTVNVSGGGGSSDFSTAEVTITNSTSSNITQSCIAVIEYAGEEGLTSTLPPLGANQSITCDMVLFKGTQGFYAPDDVYITVTGDITEEEGWITITGDGTITYDEK